MIVERRWHKFNGHLRKDYSGWFLLGFIPLYIKSTDWLFQF